MIRLHQIVSRIHRSLFVHMRYVDCAMLVGINWNSWYSPGGELN